MKPITIAGSRRHFSLATAALLVLGAIAALLPGAPPADAARKFWPSMTLNHYTGVKVGEKLKVTGKGFPPRIKVTLFQCNQGLLDTQDGVFTKKTCDLKNTPTVKTSSKGTFTTTFTVKVKEVAGATAAYISTHTRILGGLYDSWTHSGFSLSATASFLTSSPTETFLNPQAVQLTGLLIPAVAAGSADFAAECNDNVLLGDAKACGPPVRMTTGTGGNAAGKLSMVMGGVGDGTCGTGTADEVCYIELVNVTATGVITPVTSEAVDFYEMAGTAHTVAVTGGGTTSASAAKAVLTDGHVSVTCSTKGSTPASTAAVTIANGTTRASAPHPVGIAADLAFSNCAGPLGSVHVTTAGLPYPVNANSATSSAATAMTISGIDVSVTMTGCSFTVTGSGPGDYSNSTRILALTPDPKPKGLTGAKLSISKVKGCAGLIKNGQHPTYTASYKLSPATLAITSAG